VYSATLKLVYTKEHDCAESEYDIHNAETTEGKSTCVKAMEVILSVFGVTATKNKDVICNGAHPMRSTRSGNTQVHLQRLGPFVCCCQQRKCKLAKTMSGKKACKFQVYFIIL
jgi:hypothetical protein